MDLYFKNKTKYYPNETKPEIYVQIKKGRGKITIKVDKNITLIKEKEKIINHNKNKFMFKNVIVMFFDTISRVHFFRKFPKVTSFFNNFTRYETNYSRKKMTIFEFFKFNSIKQYTDPNLKAAYYGSKINGNGTYFAKYFKEQGYIIGKTTTFCEKTSAILHNYNKLNEIRWDHEGISIPCIKGIYRGFFINKLTSLIKKCLFGKQVFEYALEYLESFLKAYFDYNKMFLFESGEGHEPTGQVVGYLDDILYNFFFKLYSENYLLNTTIILFSDHGLHLNWLLYVLKFKDFMFELTLPFLFIIFPNTQELYNDSLYEKIKNNQQVFITPYDIYYTLIHIALGVRISEINKNQSSNYYGESLLTPINYSLRYCESQIYDSQINSYTCKCKINIKK
jgi:hypothetical protein